MYLYLSLSMKVSFPFDILRAFELSFASGSRGIWRRRVRGETCFLFECTVLLAL